MILSTWRLIVPILAVASTLQGVPDISNLDNCINDVRTAESSSPPVPTFDIYKQNYQQLIADLQAASAAMPYVYQEAAAKPLIAFLEGLGEQRFLRIFSGGASDPQSGALQEIIPDAALSILFHNSSYVQAVDSFQEIVSDLYDSFVSDELRVGQQTGRPINSPTYGVIPPLVKFGNADFGPYTWPCDATSQVLGMKCAIVSLPPAQLVGGILAWSSLGHETGGHDVLHADEGLLKELAQKVYSAVLSTFKSQALASYWASCIDETASDVCGYLHMGPNAGIGLIGFFRALGNGKLRTIGSKDDPHPIDLLRGYLAASVVKRLNFKDAAVWSQVIASETSKDNNKLYLVDQNGVYYRFPVRLGAAIASADLVASVIMQSKLNALQGYSLQDIQNWNDNDQDIVDTLASQLVNSGQLPDNLSGPGFYAAHVVSASIQAALQNSANISSIFNGMFNFLSTMHRENPTWSVTQTPQALELLERLSLNGERRESKLIPRPVIIKLPEVEEAALENAISLEEEEAEEENVSVG